MLPKAKWLRVWFITALPQSWGQGVALDQEPPGGGAAHRGSGEECSKDRGWRAVFGAGHVGMLAEDSDIILPAPGKPQGTLAGEWQGQMWAEEKSWMAVVEKEDDMRVRRPPEVEWERKKAEPEPESSRDMPGIAEAKTTG